MIPVSHQLEQAGLFDEPARRDPGLHWDAARAAHHLGRSEMPYDPYWAKQDGYVPRDGSGITPAQVHKAYDPVPDHQYRQQNGELNHEYFYSPRESQTVMTIHEGQLRAPMRIRTNEDLPPADGISLTKPAKIEFDGSHPLELDHHGNAEDTRHPPFRTHSPARNPDVQAVWDEHGRDVTIHPETPLHTGQAAWSTGDISHIVGEIRDDKPIPIIMQGGTPYLMDGHHRRAAAAARGVPIRGRVVTREQVDEHLYG